MQWHYLVLTMLKLVFYVTFQQNKYKILAYVVYYNHT